MRCDREPHQQAFIPKQQSMGPSCGRLALANHPYDLTVTCQEHIVKKMLEAAFVWVTLGVNVLLARSQLNILVQTWYRPRGVISECIWWQTSAPNNEKKKKLELLLKAAFVDCKGSLMYPASKPVLQGVKELPSSQPENISLSWENDPVHCYCTLPCLPCISGSTHWFYITLCDAWSWNTV